MTMANTTLIIVQIILLTSNHQVSAQLLSSFNNIVTESLSNRLTEKFLTQFFNASIDQIGRVANNFTFVTVSPDAVNLLLYKPNSDLPTPLTLTTLDNPSVKIIICIHGWTDNGEKPWIKTVARNYYNLTQNIYVLALDWRKMASGGYLEAATAVQSVGYIAAGLLWNLIGKNPDRLNNVHVIGHSLGAQVSGFLGKKIRTLSNNKKVDRITGLDAAAPFFTIPLLRPTSLRIYKSDAGFVDVYHSSIYLQGQRNAAGHIDVYWNCGGPIQPGCWSGSPLEDASCSHQAAPAFFAATINDGRLYPVTACSPLNFSSQILYSGAFVGRDVAGRFCGSTVKKSGQKCVIFYGD